MQTLKTPEVLHIRDGDTFYYGADQIWYRMFLQRRAGCGPTTAAHLVWYFASARPGMQGLTKRDARTKTGFIALMDDMWRYVTPGMRGVNTTGIFIDGVSRYGQERGYPVQCSALEVAHEKDSRPHAEEFLRFIERAIRADRPVAFLNLHNGSVEGLDTWHWVTLVGVDTEAGTALMYDQGKRVVIDITSWLLRTQAGGGLVCMEW